MEAREWDEFVRDISRGWNPSTPEGVMKNYHRTLAKLTKIRERIKNPVSRRGGGQLSPATIRSLEREEKVYNREVAAYQKLIKKLVKHNLLPTSKLISGDDRRQFVFSLGVMLELPELGKAVYYANRLISSVYDCCASPSTDEDYLQRQAELGMWNCVIEQKKELRSRESMCNAIIDSLNEAISHIRKERQRFLTSGKIWKPKDDSKITDTRVTEKPTGLRVIRGGKEG